ncbi:protein of unknown function (plasmid) [Shinella sp. WSC3-e]|nr:protein of unknown function [Shinella sp. WSC3-e]
MRDLGQEGLRAILFRVFEELRRGVLFDNDKRAIFQAAAHAQRAVTFLHSLQPGADVKAAA